MRSEFATTADRYHIRLPYVLMGNEPFKTVTGRSPRRDRLAVERLGLYFKREMQYDFAPWSASDNGVDDIVVHLLPIPTGCHFPGMLVHVCGAVGFHRNYYSEQFPGRWVLTWAWIHPFARGRGLLSAAWPEFKERYQEFILQPPISAAMQRVATAQGYKHPVPQEPQ